jgi:S-adenosylmethionine:tRNA ribosyltransferase-isomerase
MKKKIISSSFWIIAAIHIVVFTAMGLFGSKGWRLLIIFLSGLAVLLLVLLAAKYLRKLNLNKKSRAEDIPIEDFDYDLPDERIAKFPLIERDQSKLLVWRKRKLTDSSFQHLSEFIPENALLVFNNTRVIQARMIFRKNTGAQIEIFCLEPKDPADYTSAFAQSKSCSWICLIGNAKRWKEGKLECLANGARCSAERVESYGETHWIRFEWDNPDWNFADVLEHFGELPIPPYLNRKTEESDKVTYQTIYSKIKGSVAAPTAGLHFTEAVFQSLKEKHIDVEELTLHVGAGTFKPVKSKILADHVMHTECISVKKTTVEKLMGKEGLIFAVGTTSVRSLESLYYIGVKLEKHSEAMVDELAVGQWTPYSTDTEQLTVHKALKNILDYLERKGLDTLTTQTQIMIAPGYDFKIVDGMITNFHQPKSTLLLLISAFAGGNWREIYEYALANEFRFLSYGDSSLLFRK